MKSSNTKKQLTTEDLVETLKAIRDAVVAAKTDTDFSGSYTELRYKEVLEKMMPIVAANKPMPSELTSEFVEVSKHILAFAAAINRTDWLLYEREHDLQRPS